MNTILSVRNLEVEFETYGGIVKAVRGVSFDVTRGETLAIVGESGCGKSVTVQALMGLIPVPPGKITNGTATFNGKDILNLPTAEANKFRGVEVGMIFQDPMSSLNPTMTIGDQIAETLKVHRGKSQQEAFKLAVELLERTHIAEAPKRAKQYPFEFSGGMLQRAMIAQSLACNPAILIADEPTTALDVTIQAQVLRLMRNLQEELGTAIVFITHDLGVVAEVADDVMVMYCGKIVEQGTVFEVFENPKHPYTIGLMQSLPKLTDHKEAPLEAIKGMVPSLFDLPEGCRFSTRCDHVEDICDTLPPLVQIGDTHAAACHLHEKVGVS